MKYTLWYGQDEIDGPTVGILSRDGVQMFCPFVAETNHCGSWCPLFEVHEESFDVTPLGPRKNACRVRLHCGASTRVIEIDAPEQSKGGEA